MGADSTAAAYLMDRQKAFDPIGSYTAGVQLQTNLQKINLAGQASQIDTILNVVKMQNEQADQKRKDDLTKQQLSIATYNAETNRMNALRPRTTKAADTGGGMESALGMMGFDPATGKFYLKTGQPQGPTEGQGDGPEVQTPTAPTDASNSAPPPEGQNNLGTHVPGLDPFGMNAMTADQQVQRQQAQRSGGSLFPGGGAMQSTDPSMAGPSMPGGAPQSVQGNGRLYIKPPRITINSKGQPSMSFEVEGADPNAPPPLPTSQQLAALSAPYAHLGMQAVPDAENKRGYTFKEIPKLTGHDLSIATLPAETQKGFYEDVNAMIKLAGNTEGPSDVQKMEAMGVNVEKDSNGDPTPAGLEKAGQEMRDKGLSWREGFNRAQAKNDNDLIAKAAVYANKLNAAMHGKQGWQTKTALDVINDIGLKPPASIISSQLAAAPGGRTVSVAGAGQDTAGGAPAPAAGVASVGGVKVAAQPGPGRFMTPDAAPGTVTPSGNPLADEIKRAQMIQTEKDNPSQSSERAKQLQENTKWDDNKLKVLKAMNDTSTTMKDFSYTAPKSGPRDLSKGGAIYEMTKWLDEHKDKLDIKPLDGKPLTMDSPIFKANDGREVKLKEIFRSMTEDRRFSGTPQEAVKQGATELTDAEKALLGN